MHYNYLIIGAGISGLWASHHLNTRGSVLVVDKSRGVGGRMATRRLDQYTFDHGAQFIRKTDLNEKMIQNWSEKSLVREIAPNKFSALGGMTKLAKDLGANLNILLDCKITKIKKEESKWIIFDQNDQSWIADHVILTCPLPQSLDILKTSGIPYHSSLDTIEYNKAIVFLVSDPDCEISNAPQDTTTPSPVFSIFSQLEKGTSSTPAWVLTMTPSWSEKNFSKSDTDTFHEAEELLKSYFPSLERHHVDIKRWKYAEPKTIAPWPVYSPLAGLYLIGDAFAGPSINGAIKSADALINKTLSYEK